MQGRYRTTRTANVPGSASIARLRSDSLRVGCRRDAIRAVQGSSELDQVFRLTHDAFVERGYCAPQPAGLLRYYRHLDGISQTTVLVAVSDGRVTGTISLTTDGPQGLHADQDFGADCDAIRRENRKLGAAWRLVCRGAPCGRLDSVSALIQEAARRGVAFGIRTCVFTVHPRHESFYKRLLNARTVARSDGMAELTNSPALLMRWDLDRSEEEEVSG